ncbi:unnamed protein product [Ambrosiozyma monospora]|uniref:Unnamed protein product n=1 Tax=Ambrosiozyma monospora TaxID=43982 RepID=A0A9W6T348_AMBMO|nr:unnamed protein product [Ambrosiozyma monospora]
MTTTLTLTRDQTINPIAHISLPTGASGNTSFDSKGTELDEIHPILDIYSKALSLSRRLRNSEDVDEINGLLMEATFWENKLESLKQDINHFNVNVNSNSKAYFEFFRLVGKLLFNQLIQQNQSSATKTRLLVSQITSILPQILNQPVTSSSSSSTSSTTTTTTTANNISKCLLIYPLFITGIDIIGQQNRLEFQSQFEKLLLEINSNSMTTILVILNEIWKLNPNGCNFVDWVNSSSQFFFAIN